MVHGDVKPKNVLIFENGAGSYTAKVADFGFSTHFHSELEDLIQMPESIPWTAPEYHRRRFTSQSAQAMDMYSFGMLCLWLLFDAVPSRVQDDTTNFSFEAEPWKGKYDLLLTLKNHRLLDWAVEVVANDAKIGDELKTQLKQFFLSSLHPNPELRMTNWDHLLHFLAPIQ
jgi:serine/threonine protein kinase